MSNENITLLILAILLCSLNLVFGPLGAGIARLIARASRPSRRMKRRGAGGPEPSDPDSVPPVIGDAQISKYR
jgi:hypothetical protein